MKITKKKYAEEIAKIVGGNMVEVEKGNGVVLTGITPNEDFSIRPTVYIDQYFKDSLPINKAAEAVKTIFEANLIPEFDTSFLFDFDKAKEKLRLRLYNEKTNAEIFKSAEQYGFNDLIVVPVVDDIDINGGMGACKVSNRLLSQWNATADEVFSIAEQNSLNTDFYKIQSINEIFAEMMGVNEVPENMRMQTPMYVISNLNKCYGAFSVIALKEKNAQIFPNGYFVIPSSVHEVIIIPSDTMEEDQIDAMIQEVNSTQVSPEEVLSNKVYRF